MQCNMQLAIINAKKSAVWSFWAASAPKIYLKFTNVLQNYKIPAAFGRTII